jgi:hypothetical protein
MSYGNMEDVKRHIVPVLQRYGVRKAWRFRHVVHLLSFKDNVYTDSSFISNLSLAPKLLCTSLAKGM